MKKLPVKLNKEGFELTLVERVDKVAIYRHHFPDGSKENDDFEVVIPQVYTRDFTGKEVEPYESYPGSGMWGKKGWTFSSGKYNPRTRMVEREPSEAALGRARLKLEQLSHENLHP